MSQFDFPRINFFGKCSVDVGTANNDDYKPTLMLYDFVNTQIFMPPRVYVSDKQISEGQVPDQYKDQLQDACTSEGEAYKYLAISDIDTDEKYLEWAVLPLGDSALDSNYHALYNSVKQGNGNPLAGIQPAEWNYNGGMGLTFEDTTVVSVATCPTDNSGSHLYLASDPGDCPADLKPFLGATFDCVNKNGKNTGVICDVNPAAPFASQFFYENFALRDSSNNTLMYGTPTKGVTRGINFGRITNITPSPMIACGGMYHAIPLDQLEDSDGLVAAFKAHGDSSKTLMGAFVRYDMYEVWEDRAPDYTKLPNFGRNPAYVSIVGTISPWYEGDMCSDGMGRILQPKSPFGKQAVAKFPLTLAPVFFNADTTSNVLSLDFYNTLPEERSPVELPHHETGTPPPETSYTMYDLGQLDIMVAGETGAIASLNVGPSGNYTRQDFINNGGFFDYVYTGFDSGTVDSELFSLTGSILNMQTGQMEPGTLMEETRYRISSDQSAAYGEQNGSTSDFISQKTTPEPIVLRVFDKGVPVPQGSPVSTYVQQWYLDCVFNLEVTQNYPGQSTPMDLYDGITFDQTDTSEPNILTYYFAPPGFDILNDPNDQFTGTTEYFIGLRVLPDQSEQYAGYYRAPDEEGYKELNWMALYNEIFRTYYLLYPAMQQQMPFNQPAQWEEPFAASRLKKVIQLDMWQQPWYMPRTRGLSAAQRKLITTWVDNFMKQYN